MKVFLAFAFLVVGISATAVPKTGMKFDFTNERLVSGQIESAIEDVSQAIKDAGLDPFHIERESSSYALPVPVLFNYEAIIDNLLSTGLSDIRIHRVNYSVLTNRLNFDIELPLIHLSVGSAKADAELLSNELGFETSGTIEIVSIRVSGVVRVSVGIISGISIRSVNVEMKLGDVNSDVNLVILGRDYSKAFNDFVGVFVPYTIKAHEWEINELLGIVLKEVIEANLN